MSLFVGSTVENNVLAVFLRIPSKVIFELCRFKKNWPESLAKEESPTQHCLSKANPQIKNTLKDYTNYGLREEWKVKSNRKLNTDLRVKNIDRQFIMITVICLHDNIKMHH